jgi:uncharacterized protein (TIGR02118 family)
MIKLVFCLVRRAEMEPSEFHRYWREVHAPLVASHAETLGIRRYVQSHTAFPSLTRALAGGRGAPEGYDGVAEIWLDSVEALVTAGASPEGEVASQALLIDERRFIDHSRSPIFLAEEHVVLPS